MSGLGSPQADLVAKQKCQLFFWIPYNSVTIPLEPDSLLYGSFKITSNDGGIVKDITRNEKLTQCLNVVEKKKDHIEFELDISKYYTLSPGEYNVSFIYHEQETPTISIEVYVKGY